MVVMGRYPRAGLIRRLNRQALDAAHQALARVGLDHLAARSLPALSAGQFQRALIARALASEPEVLVLDEPTTGMDLVAERSLLDLVATFRDELHLGVLMVSHQLSLVASRAHEVLLVDGQRQQVRHGSVDEVITPASLSELYQQPVTVDRRDGHVAVFLQEGGS
jgi:ABC-type Mn2+/Zn2+ transport system ATPase subunit